MFRFAFYSYCLKLIWFCFPVYFSLFSIYEFQKFIRCLEFFLSSCDCLFDKLMYFFSFSSNFLLSFFSLLYQALSFILFIVWSLFSSTYYSYSIFPFYSYLPFLCYTAFFFSLSKTAFFFSILSSTVYSPFSFWEQTSLKLCQDKVKTNNIYFVLEGQ